MDGRTCYVPEGPGLDIVRASKSNSPAVCHLKAFSEKSKLVFLKSAILKCVCTILTWSARKDPEQGWCSSFSSLVLFLPHFQSGCGQADVTSVSRSRMCVDLWAFLVPGNNVMRTIHGGGRDDDPDGAQQRLYLPHECAWHSAQPTTPASREPHWSRGTSPSWTPSWRSLNFTGKGLMGGKQQAPTCACWLNVLTFCSRSRCKYSEMLLI